jgi:mRNA-degrading endonuclease RelE of RelBE toxin-antitoxin system
MSYHVEVAPPARREIETLPGYVRAQARQLIGDLRLNPKPPRAVKLRDKPNIYRIWLATKWRIAYKVDEDAKQVLILRVRLKELINYESLQS